MVVVVSSEVEQPFREAQALVRVLRRLAPRLLLLVELVRAPVPPMQKVQRKRQARRSQEQPPWPPTKALAVVTRQGLSRPCQGLSAVRVWLNPQVCQP